MSLRDALALAQLVFTGNKGTFYFKQMVLKLFLFIFEIKTYNIKLNIGFYSIYTSLGSFQVFATAGHMTIRAIKVHSILSKLFLGNFIHIWIKHIQYKLFFIAYY